MSDRASHQSFFFMAYTLTGTKLDTTAINRGLRQRCPVSVWNDKVYGIFR